MIAGKMGYRLLMLVLAGLAASGSGAAPIESQGQPTELPSDDLYQTLYDRATEAGSSAGLAEACGAYPGPVDTAFKAMLGSLHVDAAQQAALWQRYKNTESSSVSILTKQGAIRCADATTIILCTLHDLARPISLGTPPEASLIASLPQSSDDPNRLEPGTPRNAVNTDMRPL